MASGGNEVNEAVVCDDKGEPMRVGDCEPNEKAVCDGKGKLMGAGGNEVKKWCRL